MNRADNRNSERLVSYCSFEDVLPLIATRKTPSLPINPKTVIVCLFPYYVGEYPRRNVARYAMINDYHKICGGLLESFAEQLRAAFPHDGFMAFIDSSPIREVHAASLAGLGAIGRHGMLIHETYGSRVFIGTITSSLELAPKTGSNPNTTGSNPNTTGLKPDTVRSLFCAMNDSDARNEPKAYTAKACLDCGKCINACPTGAISKDKPLDKTLCRSAITQKKSALTNWEREQVKAGGFAWGCDICADICPMNAQPKNTPVTAFYDDIAPVLTKENLGALMKKKPYGWRGKAVLLRNLSILEES